MLMSSEIQYITTTEQLVAFCQDFRQDCLTQTAPFMTVDTEFVRRSTYWARPALIQIASPHRVGLIDVVANNLGLAALKSLFVDQKIVKVFHSCRQDCEIILQLLGVLPTPLYDTQIAAMAMGFGESVSYETLVSQYLNIKLDKTQQFTNWLLRPLSPAQIQYAAKDVIHLRCIYEKMQQALTTQQRCDWIEEEMQALVNSAFILNPQDAWKRLKIRALSRKIDSVKFTQILQKIAAWRETQAQTQNIPRLRILSDEIIIDAAITLANSELITQKIDKIFLKKTHLFLHENPSLYQILKETLQQPLEPMSVDQTDRLEKKKTLSPNKIPLFNLLCLVLNSRAEHLKIVSKLLTTPAEIEQYLIEPNYNANFLQGWRWQMFGEDAKGLKEGKKALYFEEYFKTTSL